MTEITKEVQHILVFGCGHKIAKSKFQAPVRFNLTDRIEYAGEGTLCASCLTQCWEENRKQGFSIRDTFHSMLKEEGDEKEDKPEESTDELENERH